MHLTPYTGVYFLLQGTTKTKQHENIRNIETYNYCATLSNLLSFLTGMHVVFWDTGIREST